MYERGSSSDESQDDAPGTIETEDIFEQIPSPLNMKNIAKTITKYVQKTIKMNKIPIFSLDQRFIDKTTRKRAGIDSQFKG